MANAHTHLQIGDWLFDPASGRLSRDGDVVSLPALSAQVLGVLAADAPEPVNQARLAQAAWDLAHVSDDTIAQRIAMLRRTFEDDPKAPRYIRTVRGRGYALIADITPVAAPAQPAKPAPASGPRRASLWAGAAIIGALMMAGAVAVLGRGGEEPGANVTAAEPGAVDDLLARARPRLSLQDPASAAQAIALLEQARAQAPDDSRVLTALAFALTTEATKFGGERAGEAEALARSALELDPDRSAAWHALGYALDAQSRIDEALAAYGEALALDPGDSAARSSAAYLLTVRGQLYDGLVMDVAAAQANAGNLYVDLQIARTLRLLGEDPLARQFEARARRLNPGHPVVAAGLAEAALSRGDADAALGLIESAGGAEATGELARLSARAFLMRGRVQAALDALEYAGDAAFFERYAFAALSGQAQELTESQPLTSGEPSSWPDDSVHLAEALAASGRTEEALAALTTAINLGFRDAGALRQSPFLSELAASGALEPVLERIDREITAQVTRLNRDTALRRQLATLADG
ncbi:winged helix-turn-helix domain-containing protein [Maricaulaceae bacterium MS644]